MALLFLFFGWHTQKNLKRIRILEMSPQHLLNSIIYGSMRLDATYWRMALPKFSIEYRKKLE